MMLHQGVETSAQIIQRAYGMQEFGTCQNMCNSFVFSEGGTEEKGNLWMAEVLQLFRIIVRGNER